MLVAAAVCPCPPLLVPEVAAGAAAEMGPVRAACDAAVGALAGARPDRLVVVGPDVGKGAEPVTYPQGSPGSFHGFGVPLDVRLGPGPAAPPDSRERVLPPALTLAAWLLGRAALETPVHARAVPEALPPGRCAAEGAALAAGPARTALLVMGDASACRSVKAPGYLDERAEPFDAAAARALGAADTAALLAIDPALAWELKAAGRAPWQVLAGAAGDAPMHGALLHDSAPYGVGYLVAAWASDASTLPAPRGR
ncbi:class III extradiol dioxygenase subunit B-like domain-containing protein [Streptomyces sp. NPDC050560]|uniref:class III extradiol dioxygenase subunit B-like domain-containing protein n=1 Tax=Streptomyces sp. NPDC050560 TaxID=3365630 RepID=UPI003790EC9C